MCRNDTDNPPKTYPREEGCYSGAKAYNFERKFMFIIERCKRIDILENLRHHAFSFMLCGIARQVFFDALSNLHFELDSLATRVRDHFQTSERTQT